MVTELLQHTIYQEFYHMSICEETCLVDSSLEMDNTMKPVDWEDDPISYLDTSTLKGCPHITDVSGQGISSSWKL